MADVDVNSLTRYFEFGLKYSEIAEAVRLECNIILSNRTVRRRLNSVGLYRRRGWSNTLFETIASCFHFL